MRKVDLAKDETIISEGRLKVLLAKEQSHDAYLWAMKRMADLTRKPGRGREYREALDDFSRLVVEAPLT